MEINDVCDYTIVRLHESGEGLSNIKLQKLLYYIQAWHLTFFGERLFDNDFQAWIHGPVNRQIYDRFSETKSLYSDITIHDVRPSFNQDNLEQEKLNHINTIIEAYAKYSGSELEQMTHDELPWISAREGFRATERCETPISDELITACYGARLT